MAGEPVTIRRLVRIRPLSEDLSEKCCRNGNILSIHRSYRPRMLHLSTVNLGENGTLPDILM